MDQDNGTFECFNDWGRGNTTASSPRRSPKQPLPGIGLHDPVYGWQACPELNSFHRGAGKISPREVSPVAERCCPPAATAATITPPSDAPFAPAQDTLPCNAASSRSPAIRRNRTDIRGVENMAAIVEARAVKIVAGATECFNDLAGRGYDDSVPGVGAKTTPSGDRTT